MKKKPTAPKLHIGTSGWVYKSWHKMFYPENVKKEFLRFYSTEFNTVEVNTSFYHLPKRSTFEKWRSETLDDFIFGVKMSRYVTHIERLKVTQEPLDRFFAAAAGLSKKLGIILVQLPPSLRYDEKTFAAFIRRLDKARTIGRKKVRIALEPRHDSWFDEENMEAIRALMKKQGMSLVFAHSAVFPRYEPVDENILTDYVYLRFHGPKEFALSQYGRRRLKPWAEMIQKWRNKGLLVFAYFNDDAHRYAVKDAKILEELVSE